VFSYASGEIKAIGVVENLHRECDCPSAFGKTGEQWDKNGWAVPINWFVLKAPISPKSHLDAIRPFLPSKNSPIRPNGNGNQGCYLAEISNTLGGLLFQLVQTKNPILYDVLDDARNVIQEVREEERLAG
jgi:putative restriction endonuclease